MRPKLKEGIVVKRVKSDFYAFDRANREMYELNEISFEILRMCNGERSIESIAEELAEKSQSSFERAYDYTREFIKEIENIGMLK